MASDKYVLPSAQHLVVLVVSIGMSESGCHWGSSLTKLHTELIKLGYMRARKTKAYEDSNWSMQFGLTKRGEILLALWTPEELLIECKHWWTAGIVIGAGIPKETITEHSLTYVVRRFPMERLAEYLAHPLPRVRWAAETRWKELQNGT